LDDCCCSLGWYLSRLYVDELSFEEETALVDLFAGEVIVWVSNNDLLKS
jgi:hypothetical protein